MPSLLVETMSSRSRRFSGKFVKNRNVGWSSFAVHAVWITFYISAWAKICPSYSQCSEFCLFGFFLAQQAGTSIIKHSRFSTFEAATAFCDFLLYAERLGMLFRNHINIVSRIIGNQICQSI